MTEKTTIPIDNSSNSFGEFLELENNKRIFFSAPFGMGKTYFLRKFFKEDEANKEKYDVFHLYPVKYQVHNDVDIVELIGADLFIRIRERHETIVKSFLKNENTQQDLENIANLLLKGLTNLLLKNAINVGIDYDDIKKLCGDKITSNIENAQERLYSNFFEDLVTEILWRIKEKNEGEDSKERVLILDDLDRLEPRHIFKLLNAFSPLGDNEENKYGFDKVIFVGDIDNLEKVFHHIYGQSTDFQGYINKFFSANKPYEYDIQEELNRVIEEIISKYYHGMVETPIKKAISGYVTFVLLFILMLLIRMGQVNLRGVFAPQNITLFESNFLKTEANVQVENIQADIIVEILLQILQSKDHLLSAIKILDERLTDNPEILHRFSSIDIAVSLTPIGSHMLALTTERKRNPHGIKPQKESPEDGDKVSEYDKRVSKASNLEHVQVFLSVFHDYIKHDVHRNKNLSTLKPYGYVFRHPPLPNQRLSAEGADD